MAFNGQTNPPWQRNMVQGSQMPPFHQNAMFLQQSGAPQPSVGSYGHGPVVGNNMYGHGNAASVSYPQPRTTALNPVAFQQAPIAGAVGGAQPQHYNSIGTVTKISNDCGLVNDEVFFYRNVCKGSAPKLGDRVLFEASYSSTGQFKWNATRIQLMPTHHPHQPQPLMGKKESGYSAVPPPNEYQRAQQQRHVSPRRGSPGRERHVRIERERRERPDRDRIHRSRERDDEEQIRKRRREDTDRSRERVTSNAVVRSSNIARGERDRERDRDVNKPNADKRDHSSIDRKDRDRERERVDRADRSPHRSVAKGRRARTIRRYMVQIPKALLSYKTADVQELRQRYPNLYIPSEFFHANIKWSDTFTPDNAFSLHRPSQFHIMHRIVDPPFEQIAEDLAPADANFVYSAKVMLMACPPIAEIYQKCFEDDEIDTDQHALHPTRLISFLVGTRRRNEPMCIGGPWSPSLDGENPDTDPAVLIRTAIRTCFALTGIDLSNCTQWYRFVELYYHREEYKNKEKDDPPRIETVVIYLPDIHSCMPNLTEWQKLSESYKENVENVIERNVAAFKEAADENATSGSTTLGNDSNADSVIAVDDGEGDDNGDDNGNDNSNDNGNDNGDGEADADADADEDDNNYTTTDAADVSASAEESTLALDEGEDGDDIEFEKEPSPKPTHYSKLDLKSMKVQDIRDELDLRNLSPKGPRNLIMARLAKAINTERAEHIELTKKLKLAEKLEYEKNLKKSIEAKSNPKKTIEAKPTPKKPIETKPIETKPIAPKPTPKKPTPKKPADIIKPAPKIEDDDVVMVIDDDDEEEEVPNVQEPEIIESDNAEKSDCEVVEDETNDENKADDENEDPEEWADVDMNDIVILDEYDATKNPEEGVKEMTEKEKEQLKRRYTLPSAPHIIVHPNKLAKGGKFDCSVMSLSVLLDYRADPKERFFEVSYFAELFNEMLMRDFGFNIYKELHVYQGTQTNEATDGKDEESSKKDEEKVDSNKNDEKAADKKTNADGGKPGAERRGSKRSKDDDANEEDDQSAKSTGDRKHKSTREKENGIEKKMVVVKPQLLLSFVYFDTTHCGYIFEKDLEDLFAVIGLNLSRGQIRKVLGKLATRQAFYYRKLTDKEESLVTTPAIEDADDIPSEELKHIALGNRQYEFVFNDAGFDTENNEEVSVCAGSGDGLVNFNGAVVHVAKLMEQIKRTEKNCSDLDKLYNDIRKQHTDLQKEHSKTSTKIKDLQSEVKSLNRKLSDADQDVFTLNRKYKDQQSTLSYIYNRVSPYFSREKDKDKEHKSESSRDKDSEKEKDKSKEKDSKDHKDKEKSKENSTKSDDKQNKKTAVKEKTTETAKLDNKSSSKADPIDENDTNANDEEKDEE